MNETLMDEATQEFKEQFGNIIATQDETNFCNDDDANERIYIVEYLPDPTKYAFIADAGNGYWTLIKIVDKSEVIVNQNLVELHNKQREEYYAAILKGVSNGRKES